MPTSAAAQEWQLYVSRQDGFSINFPGTPQVTETKWQSQLNYTLPARFDVYRPARPNGAGIISIVSGGWQSSVEMSLLIAQTIPVEREGGTVFAVRHGSSPRYPMSAALTKAGVPASFIRIEGAGHGFSGADRKRVTAALVEWFEQYLGSAAK
jgi:acetyl esterase/lipase